jgi:hypothetical protein
LTSPSDVAPPNSGSVSVYIHVWVYLQDESHSKELAEVIDRVDRLGDCEQAQRQAAGLSCVSLISELRLFLRIPLFFLSDCHQYLKLE